MKQHDRNLGPNVVVGGGTRGSFSSLMALVLIGAEYVAVSLRFDAQPLVLRSDGWRMVGHVGELLSMIVVAAAAAGLMALAGGRSLRPLLVSRPLDRAVALWLATQLAAFAWLWWLTGYIFGPGGPPQGAPAVYLAALGGTAAALTTLTLAAAIPPGRRLVFLARALPIVGGGLVVGLGAWLVARGGQRLWPFFAPLTLRGVQLGLHLLTGSAVLDLEHAVVGTTAFQVEVAADCAGFEGVGLGLVFMATYLVLARSQLRFPRALWLLPMAVLGAWLGNLVRIVALILVGGVSPEAAVGGFHAKAGWLIFCALTLGLVIGARRSRYFSRQPLDLALGHPTAAFLIPFLAVVAAAFVTGLGAKAIDLLYGVRIVAGVAALYAFRRHYRDLWPRPDPWQSGPARGHAGVAGVNWAITIGLGITAGVLFLQLAPQPEAGGAAAWWTQWQSLSVGGRIAWAAVRVAGSVLVIPCVEELAFRGYLQRRLVDPQFETVAPGRAPAHAVILAALVFGAVHGARLGGVVAGLLFGLAQRQGRGVRHAIVAHAAANAVVAGYVVAFGRWWPWA
jgi:exosortase E/protease (VPEID-CTERM system)